ncbi:hypothetical protein ORV05_11740 [Amycolatopsis cynarae]|uniref:Uncharacterized protein n=1 Tax=Amycolatopsis cynarae TaxID=2995223 RepID=A0ABY7B8X5_9PSEU|nr:hypothetical protein [Amycolatopsis sp. HUAS 11-8]WAL68405.1 hypothetical protein ORV05_11740 [Amycolatopsis sp. HUAS 11-8]
MPADFSAVIAATAQWLLRAYPPAGGVFDAALAEAQARQAATVAAWLRYPTTLDSSLLGMLGPGGSARLDWVTGVDTGMDTGMDTAATEEETAWRTWVDEVVASWAATLLADGELAAAAVAAVAGSEHADGLAFDFRRLTHPDDRDRQAAALLRHPDLLAPVAELHRDQLDARLGRHSAEAA